MDHVINTKLFSVANVIAIGAILIFWSAMAYLFNHSTAA
jgi:hypothetical protein